VFPLLAAACRPQVARQWSRACAVQCAQVITGAGVAAVQSGRRFMPPAGARLAGVAIRGAAVAWATTSFVAVGYRLRDQRWSLTPRLPCPSGGPVARVSVRGHHRETAPVFAAVLSRRVPRNERV